MTSVTDDDKLSFDQAETLRDWLQIDGPTNTLGSGYQASIYLYQGPAGEFVIKKALGSTLRRRLSEASIRREEQVSVDSVASPVSLVASGCLTKSA